MIPLLYLEWRFRPLNDPDNLLARLKTKDMSLYADLATNSPAILMNLGVEILKKNGINLLERDFFMRPDFNIETGQFDASLSPSSELTDPPTNNTFSLPQAQIVELRRLGALQQINGKEWQVSKQGVCATRPTVAATTLIRQVKVFTTVETSCLHFVSKILPDVTRQIETTTSRDQVFSSVKGKPSKFNSRLERIMASKLNAWEFFSSIASENETNNHHSAEAIIYRSRLVVCIMDEFRHGEPNGQISRFILTSESDSREMTYIEAADKIRTTMKNKSKRE